MEILTSRQMREIDRRAARVYGVSEIVLMEKDAHAAYSNFARVTRHPACRNRT